LSEQTEQLRDDAGRFTTPPEHRAIEVTTSMDSAVDKGGRPFDAFTPMARMEPAEKPAETYDSDQSGVREASRELVRKRQELEQNAPVVPRAYHTNADANLPRRPATEVVKLSDAARDLSDLRLAESHAAEALHNLSLRERLDHFRQAADAEDRGESIPEQAPPVPEPQPETAPATPASSLAEKYERLDPDLKTALQEQAFAHANARDQYLQSVQQLGNVQAASLLAEFPELARSGNPQGTLELWRVSNPEKFAAVAGRLNQIQQVVNHWNGLQQQQHQQQAAQFQNHAKQSDEDYERYVATRPAGERKIVERNLAPMMQAYGIDQGAFMQLYHSSPVFRSAQIQRAMHDLALFHAARQGASQRGADPRVPKVFTPGDAYDRPSGESAVAQEKMRQFALDPTAKSAGVALAARRRAAALNRR
jgi:hypothetical protein